MKFTPEELRECYIDKQMTQRQIAKYLHTDVQKIRHALKCWNIPIRDRAERLRLQFIQIESRSEGARKSIAREKRPFSISHYPFTEEELHDCYTNKRMTLKDIAAQYNLSVAQVRYVLRMLDMRNEHKTFSSQEKGEPTSYLVRHYDHYKRDALFRRHSFELSLDLFKELVTQPCYYCGLPPSKKVGKTFFSGVDRIDSTLGYIEGNVRPACGNCNLGKRSLSEEEFIAWVLRTADHIRTNGLSTAYEATQG